jgi:hypothetical protein
MTMRAAALAIIAAVCCGGLARAADRPVVVELFTSQGCSSCPPADALLEELAPRADVLALGFHVDYWDSLGWKDPLSAPGSTERQRDYSRRFGRHEVYTPQMVVDGTRQMVGSNRGAVLRAIADSQRVTVAPIAFAPNTAKGDPARVMIGAGAGSGEIVLIRYVVDRQTAVPRGENAGRTAHDVDAVEDIRPMGLWKGDPVAFNVEPPPTGHGLAILVQSPDGAILGAQSWNAPPV